MRLLPLLQSLLNHCDCCCQWGNCSSAVAACCTSRIAACCSCCGLLHPPYCTSPVAAVAACCTGRIACCDRHCCGRTCCGRNNNMPVAAHPGGQGLLLHRPYCRRSWLLPLLRANAGCCGTAIALLRHRNHDGNNGCCGTVVAAVSTEAPLLRGCCGAAGRNQGCNTATRVVAAVAAVAGVAGVIAGGLGRTGGPGAEPGVEDGADGDAADDGVVQKLVIYIIYIL